MGISVKDLKRYTNVQNVSSITDVKNIDPITNKTRQYLLPSLKLHGKEFVKKFSSLHFFAAGLYDTERSIYENSITILANGKKSEIDLNIPYLIDEYFFGELLYGELHALVFELPVKGSSDRFIRGEYSLMYPNPQRIFSANIKDPFKAKLLNQALGVCTKSDKYKKELEKILRVKIDNDAELDSKPNLSKEIFNYD